MYLYIKYDIHILSFEIHLLYIFCVFSISLLLSHYIYIYNLKFIFIIVVKTVYNLIIIFNKKTSINH